MEAKKSLQFLTFFLLLSIPCYTIARVERESTETIKWKLIWKDDFNGKSIDTSVWSYMRRDKDQSRKYHSSNPLCYELRHGKLIIRGIKNPDLDLDTASYLTGAITTEGKKTFSPPLRIEIKAKLGAAKGAWPAFWMLPSKKDKGWPTDGEIDIMEHLNFDNYVYQTVHSSYTRQNPNAKPQRFVKAAINTNKFNIYRVEILADRICFYINNIKSLIYPKVDSLLNQGEYPYLRAWDVMLEMHLGRKWSGPINRQNILV